MSDEKQDSEKRADLLLEGDDPIAVCAREMADWTDARLTRIVYGIGGGTFDFARAAAANILLRKRHGPDPLEELIAGCKLLPMPEFVAKEGIPYVPR